MKRIVLVAALLLTSAVPASAAVHPSSLPGESGINCSVGVNAPYQPNTAYIEGSAWVANCAGYTTIQRRVKVQRFVSGVWKDVAGADSGWIPGQGSTFGTGACPPGFYGYFRAAFFVAWTTPNGSGMATFASADTPLFQCAGIA